MSAVEKLRKKLPRKTDFGNTGKFSAWKIFLGVLWKVGNPRGVYCMINTDSDFKYPNHLSTTFILKLNKLIILTHSKTRAKY